MAESATKEKVSQYITKTQSSILSTLGIKSQEAEVTTSIMPVLQEDLKAIIPGVDGEPPRPAKELKEVVSQVLKTNQKTILLVIYNSQNQRRYIGIKLK